MKFIPTTLIALASLSAVVQAFPSYRESDVQVRAVEGSNLEMRSELFDDASNLDMRSYEDDLAARSDETTDLELRSEDDFGLDIERRRGGGGGLEIASFVIEIFTGIANQVNQDKLNRSAFTGSVVQELSKRDPKLNYVICHTKHRYRFDGVRGKDWSHHHREFDIKIGGTIGYEIYAFKSGEFWREGDGGWLNWAFIGNVKTRDQDGKHLVMGTR